MAAATVALMLAWTVTQAISGPRHSDRAPSANPPARMIGETLLVGDADPRLWREVLGTLPACPRRVEILDANTLSEEAREKIRGLDAFVLAGQQTVVVIKQGTSLRQAQFGDAFDRLVLASVIWHEMSHAEGADESSALEREQHLWRRLVVARRVDASLGLAYIARLDETKRTRPPAAGSRAQSSSK